MYPILVTVADPKFITLLPMLSGVPGIHVLDVSADYDHNRSVITFVGDPSSVEEGAFRAIAEAKKYINHPKGFSNIGSRMSKN